MHTSKFATMLDVLSNVLSTKLLWNPSSLYDKTKTNHLAVTTRWPPFLLLRKNSSRGKEVHFPPHFPLILLMASCLGVVHKLCWQDFGFFWPPKYPLHWHFLPYEHRQKRHNFLHTLPSPFVNVVCEQPLSLGHHVECHTFYVKRRCRPKQLISL